MIICTLISSSYSFRDKNSDDGRQSRQRQIRISGRYASRNRPLSSPRRRQMFEHPSEVIKISSDLFISFFLPYSLLRLASVHFITFCLFRVSPLLPVLLVVIVAKGTVAAIRVYNLHASAEISSHICPRLSSPNRVLPT